MRLIRLEIWNFMMIQHAVLDLSKDATLILGRNEQGKSSVADALRFVLNGRCRGTDEGGRGADDLIHWGQTQTRVVLVFEAAAGTEWCLTRIRSAGGGSVTLESRAGEHLTGRNAEVRLAVVIGASCDLVDAVLDAPRILTFDPKRRSELLQRLVDAALTPEALDRAAADFGLSEPGRKTLLKAFADVPAIGPAELADVYTRAYTKRTEAKRDLDNADAALRQTPAAPSVEDEDEAHQAVDALERRQGTAREHLGTLKAKAEEYDRLAKDVPADCPGVEPVTDLPAHEKLVADLRAAAATLQEAQGTQRARVAERERLIAEADVLQTRINALPADDPPQSSLFGPDEEYPMEIEVRIRQLCAEVTKTQATRDATAAAAKKTQDAVAALRTEIAALESGSAACPSVYAPQPCQYLAAELEAKKAELPTKKTKLAKGEKTLAERTAAAKTADKALADAKAAVEGASQRLEDARARVQRRTGETQGQRAALQQQLDAMAAKIEELGDPASELKVTQGELSRVARELELADRRLTATHTAPRRARMAELAGAKGEYAAAQSELATADRALVQAREQLRDIEMRTAAAARCADLEADAAKKRRLWERLDELTRALDAKAMPAKIVESRLGPMLERINAALPKVTPNRYSVTAAVQSKVGVSFGIVPAGTDRVVRPELLSPSAQLRLGFVLAQAISIASGLRILLADAVDTLDEANRDAFMKLVWSLRGEISSSIIIATRPAPTVKSNARCNAYWFENGTAVLLEEPAAAAVAS